MKGFLAIGRAGRRPRPWSCVSNQRNGGSTSRWHNICGRDEISHPPRRPTPGPSQGHEQRGIFAWAVHGQEYYGHSRCLHSGADITGENGEEPRDISSTLPSAVNDEPVCRAALDDGNGWWGDSSAQTYGLPDEWESTVSTLCLRTNFKPDELEDLFQTFRDLAGEKEYLTPEEFRRTVRRNFGIMKEEWVKKYFKAFDRNHSGTIDFQEYVMGFAGMARVLTDKKAHSLIGLSTGTNIVRSGRNARLFWDGAPKRIAVIKKWKNPEVAARTEALVQWLISMDGLEVMIDPSEDDAVDEDGRRYPLFMPDVKRFNPKDLASQTDFVICFGGDGTVLKAAQYFDDSVPIPPMLAFGLGSLGFLAPFDPDESRSMIMRVLDAYRKPIAVTLRTRLRGEVFSRSGQLERVFYSLNEFIVNRGISGVLSTLEVFVDGQLITTAQGDGLIVASPSGSTAYNISAGGCMVSPLVPATLITPIAPHSLSFRPILTSASSEIAVRIPDNARADGWMSHDATEAVVMKKGSYVKLSTAAIPLPTVNQRELDGDWFQSIRDKLHWNMRTIQSPLHSAGTAGQWQLDADDPLTENMSTFPSPKNSTT